MHRKSKNLSKVDIKSLFNCFHFFPFDFFFIFFMYLLLLSSFCSSLSFMPPLAPSSPSRSCPSPSLFDYYKCIDMKSLHTFNCASMCLSILRCVNNSNTSCLFFFTLFITGVRKIKETRREQLAAISKYKNIDIFYYRLVSLSSIIASVELFRAFRTLFRQFWITK